MLKIHYGGQVYDAPDLELNDIAGQVHEALGKNGGLLPFKTGDGTTAILLITKSIPIVLEDVNNPEG